MVQTLLCIGYGYSAQSLVSHLEGWRIIGTTRSAQKAAELTSGPVELVQWPGTDLTPYLEAASHLLISVSPFEEGDPFLATYQPNAFTFDWVGYLSTTGVYGDHGGGWVDETTPLAPSTRRGRQRQKAEAAWAEQGLPLHVFRLAGIYGPGRGPFAKVRGGTARRIIKKGQVFSRIHVDDIGQTLAASIAQTNPGRIYNVCDDDPAPPEDVIAHAAELLGLPIPPAIPFEEAEMTPMGRSFYAESKRVHNERIKAELGMRLKFPTYREGLADLLRLEQETG